METGCPRRTPTRLLPGRERTERRKAMETRRRGLPGPAPEPARRERTERRKAMETE